MNTSTMDNSAIDFLRDFQTAIVGVIGFTGVITAQFVNAHLIRKRDDEAVKKRQKAITAIVRAELSFIRDGFLRSDPDADITEGNLMKLAKMHRKATPSVMAELGHLETTSLETILSAIATVDVTYDHLQIIAENVTETHIDFSAENWHSAATVLNNAGKRLDEALQTLPPPTPSKQDGEA